MKYSPYDVAPLIRGPYKVPLPRADLDPRAEMSPSMGWYRLSTGLLNGTRMAPREAESDFGLQG